MSARRGRGPGGGAPRWHWPWVAPWRRGDRIWIPRRPWRWTPRRVRRVLLFVLLALVLLGRGCRSGRLPWPWPRPVAPPAGPEGYLFCTWNVENLFDDRDDESDPDEMETWFGQNPAAVREKVGLLARTLRAQNGGLGPDILVVVEVENRRAVEILRDALNAGLPADRRYTGLVHRDNRTGRRIEPAVLTRLPVRDDLTRAFPPRRILEAHLEGPGGAPLVVLASHWTSRLRGSEPQREGYADALYANVRRRVRDDPSADVLLAGDFNDGPDDPSVASRLHATGDASAVRASAGGRGPVRLLDLTATLGPDSPGTYYYGGRRELFDHVVASPGLLDGRGWEVRPETFRVEAPPELRAGRDGRPLRFGGPNHLPPRGPSDHFAVTVRLTVRP